MKPYYQDEYATLYCADCRDVLPKLEPGSVDLVLTDPPYGMNNNPDTRRFSGGPHSRGATSAWVEPIHGDDKPFDPMPLLDFPRVVIWGSNHFASRLPVGTTLVWIKKHAHLFGTFLSDCELAWRKGGHGVYAFTREWSGFTRVADNGGSNHPNEKPVELMAWCIERSGCPTNGTVLDPFAGSGTTLVAAKLEGRKSIGIEIEERYCEIAANRLAQGVLDFEPKAERASEVQAMLDGMPK